MQRCRTCVIPNTRPDTYFDDTGQCAACIAYANRTKIDWIARQQELVDLLDRHNGRCIVPSSGGKDSHYQVLTLLELGAKPLVVTASTCYLTDIGRKNIDNLARYATTIEVTPNRRIRAVLNRLGLQLVGDISWPEHSAIFSIPFRVACDTRIPLIFYGENPQNQYGGPQGTEEAKLMTRRWVTEFGGFLGLRPMDFIGMEGITERDMLDYQPPPEDEMRKTGIEAHFLGQYIPWDSRHNARVAIQHGLRCRRPSPANWWTHENQDNAMTGLHDHAMYLKYGYGRLAAQISVDVRKGLVHRAEALDIVSNHDGTFPNEYMDVPVQEVLEHIGMTMSQLKETLNRFTNWEVLGQAA